MTDPERRAAEAERLLSDGLLKEAFEAIEREAYEKLLTAEDRCAPGTVDIVRDGYIRQINAIRLLQAHLKSVITQGKQSVRVAPRVA